MNLGPPRQTSRISLATPGDSLYKAAFGFGLIP